VPRGFVKSSAGEDANEHAERAVDDVNAPESGIARETYAFAKEQLPEKTSSHSMRVWYNGKCAMAHVNTLSLPKRDLA
jgi:cyanamide hydratase